MNPEPEIPKSLQLFTAEQSRTLDRQTIDHFGIDSFTLMELAARGAASHIRTVFGDEQSGLFICGKGNNAGDALAAARYLLDNASHQVSIYFVFGNSELSKDADQNHDLLKKMKKHGAAVQFISKLTDAAIEKSDYIVDGIFGTGLSSKVRSPVDRVIKKMNDAGKPIIAMDLPSGLHPDTGVPLGTAVKARHTCTFGTQKIGLYLNDAKHFAGFIKFTDLPFPSYLRKRFVTSIQDELEPVIPKIRRKADHKYQGGVVHLVAGSQGLTGAAIMAAEGAWKQGAGAVILYAPEKLLSIYEIALPHAIKITLKDGSEYTQDHIGPVLEKIKEKPGILLIGPGLGRTSGTKAFIAGLLSRYHGPAVLDADALACWDELKQIDTKTKKNWILTPHPGEAKKYLELTFNDDSSRMDASVKFVNTHNVSLLMKGNPAFYIHKSGQSFITGYSTSAFSRAGFGDVLAGTIAAIWGITENTLWAPVYALLNGYKTFKNRSQSSTFGPEHLL